MAAADREARRGGARALKAAAALVLAALAGLIGWAAMNDGGVGGEPVVVVPIGDPPVQDVAAGGVPIRESVEPGDTRLARDVATVPAPSGEVRIIDPMQAVTSTPADDRAPVRLARAPIDGLVESTEFGLLPKIGPDGLTPARAYARPTRDDVGGAEAPVRVAIVLGGLGISASGTSEAIQRLPEEVTFAFAPYGNGLQAWVDRARSQGHEVMLQLPMEPFDYPDNDPGPHTLLTSLKLDENMSRLRWLLGRFAGYIGVTNYMGAKFTASADALRPVIAEIADRGLLLVDDGASPRSQSITIADEVGLDAHVAEVTIDAGEPRERIEEALRRLEAIAAEQGTAVGAATALPLVVETVADWAKGLRRRGVALVPVSAIAAPEAT